MISDFVKQLHQLNYADMMIVARHLGAGLHKATDLDINQSVIAEALAQLGTMKVEDSIMTQQENKILREMFRTKRTISIKEFNGGFNIEISTLKGHIMHKDLKQGLAQMLDTLVTARALMK